jgi:hypothetical protein
MERCVIMMLRPYHRKKIKQPQRPQRARAFRELCRQQGVQVREILLNGDCHQLARFIF